MARASAHGSTCTAHCVALAGRGPSGGREDAGDLDETPALATIAAYGKRLQVGMGEILDDRGVVHSFAGHPSMGGLFFAETPPTNYRDWRQSDYTFYDTMARHLHDYGVLCEPDSREPWFVCEAHDEPCLADTLEAFEQAVDATLDDLDGRTGKLAHA